MHSWHLALDEQIRGSYDSFIKVFGLNIGNSTSKVPSASRTITNYNYFVKATSNCRYKGNFNKCFSLNVNLLSFITYRSDHKCGNTRIHYDGKCSIWTCRSSFP